MQFFGPPKKGWLRDARLWAVIAALTYTILGFLIVPAIIRHQVPNLARTYLGREASLREASFNPFTFVAVLRGFDLRDKDGSALAVFDELSVDLQASGVFLRAWTFREIRLVRPSAVGRILADGRLAVADLLERKAEPQKPQEPFRMPRLLIREFRLEAGKLEFQDETLTPKFATEFDPLDLQASDISTIPERAGDHAVTIGLENGTIRWTGHMTVEPLRLEGQIDVALTEFRRVADYVARSSPVRMTSGPVHLVLPYVVEHASSGSLRAEAHDVAFDVAALDFRPHGSTDQWLHFGSVALNGGRARWPEKTVDVALVKITEPEAWLSRAADGSVNWMRLLDQISASGAKSGGAAAAAGPAWKATCAAVEIAGGKLDAEDRAVEPPVTFAVSGLDARFENVTSDASVPVKARVSAKLNGTGSVAASGTVDPKGPAADLDVEVAKLELAAFQPYASQFARVNVESGAAGVRGKVSYREGGKPRGGFDGRATIDALALADPDGVRVLSWDELAVEDIRLALEPNALRVKAVTLKNPFAQILIDREGKLGLTKLRVDHPGDAAKAPASPPASSPASFPFEIGAIRLNGGRVEYGDRSLILPFHALIHATEGSLTDLSSKGAAGSRLRVEGKVDENGYAKAEGTLRVFDPYAASEIRVLFRNVDMSSLTPYTAEFAGYSIKDGRLDLDVGYTIRDRALVGNHKLTATQLTLGDKVAGAKASLPLRLAVALLKDAQGKIELEVPLEGSVDDPQFAYRKVIWSAFKRILVNVTTAPFRFLGRLLGIQGDELEYVAFEAGRSTLLPPEQEKLGKLVDALKQRPELSLQVGGRFDPVSDADAMRKDKLEALVAARRETMGQGGADEGAVLDRVLDALYAEAFSAESRKAIRAKHTTAPSAPPEAVGKHVDKRAQPPQPVLDAAGYYEELRQALLQAQTAGPEELAALARARSDAIAAALTGEGGIDPKRVAATEIEPIKKKAGQDLVPCKLAMPTD